MEHGKSEKSNLMLYFFIAFVFSWTFWVPQALISAELIVVPSFLADFLSSPFNPAAFGPLISAFSLTYLTERKEGVRKLLGRGVDYRFGKKWYIPIFFLFPAITSGALLLSVLSGDALPELSALSNPSLIVVGFIYFFFLGGPF